MIILTDLQYSLAIGGPSFVKETDRKDENSWTIQYKTKFQNDCDKLRDSNIDAESKSNRIDELEQQLKFQNAQHQKELYKKAAKIEELEKSILTGKEVCKLQNKCKNLYHDGDEIVLQRIDDISDRAARRILEHRQR